MDRDFARLIIGLKHSRKIRGERVSPWKMPCVMGKGLVHQSLVEMEAVS